MAVTVDAESRRVLAPQARTVRIGNRVVPVVLPRIRDPRIHLAITILSILTIGMVWLDFRLSIPQIAVAMLACGVIEVVRTYRASGTLVWPASALQTATSTALILRITGMQAHDWWSFDGWYYFAGIAVAGVLTKYYIRYQGRHIFNPSNVALVAAFLLFGAERIEPLDFWWGPLGWALLAAYAVIVIGGITLCRRLALLGMAAAFYATFAFGVGVLALLGQSITTQWSLTPVSGLHYWWVLVTSPETLIFLFFMITDPRTVVRGKRKQIVVTVIIAVVDQLIRLMSDTGVPLPTAFNAAPPLLALAIVGPIAKYFDLRYGNRPAPRPVTAGTPS